MEKQSPKSALHKFSEEAQREVAREVPSCHIAEVMAHLARTVALDIDVALGFTNEVSVSTPLHDRKNAVQILMTANPSGSESVHLSHALDSHWRIGDRSGLYDFLYARNSEGWQLLEEAMRVQGGNLEQMAHAVRSLRNSMGNEENPRSKVKESTDEDILLVEKVHALGSLMGMETAGKIGQLLTRKDGRGMDTIVRAMEKLLHISAEARGHALLLLQGSRLLGHAVLAESLTRQGFRTLRSIEAMSETQVRKGHIEAIDRSLDQFLKKEPRDVAKRHAEIVERIAQLQTTIEALKAKAQPPEFANAGSESEAPKPFFPGSRFMQLDAAEIELKQLEELLPREGEASERIFINHSDACCARECQKWLAENVAEPPRLLRDALRCEESRAELERLRACCKWDALGAKELEIASAVCREVFLFTYQGKSADREDYRTHSYEIGTPKHAMERRHLSCFTGAWLIATMCLESGISYDQLFYCNVHDWHEDTFGEHDVLLLKLSSGNMCFLDYGKHCVGRPISTAMIPDKKQVGKLNRLINLSQNMAKFSHKMCHDPVHVQIPKELATQLKTYSDMHVLPLDQGLTATMLLHTGIDLAEQGKDAEALLSYELGLASNPTHPDLLCRTAAAARASGDLSRAERLLELAMASYAHHLVVWYELGALRLQQGRTEDAQEWFTKVAEDPREIWGDDTYQKYAKEYVNLVQKRSELNRGSKLTRVEDYLL